MTESGNMTDIHTLSATELVALYRAKKLSPVEATRATLGRIEALDKTYNAFCLVDAEGALAAAKASEQRWAKGEPLGLVDGVPTSIKDIVLTRGWPTRRGSKTMPREKAWDEDAPAVTRLREHGAVLLGKTTTPEFGWKAMGDSPLTGITRNPWNPARTPGASSAGAAAGLVAGMSALALGSDGGGSIRIPCAFSGLAGIKATFGRVPAYPASTMGILSNVGPMARNVTDAALMLTVMSGTDDRDPYRLPPDLRHWHDGLEAGVKGLRVAFSPALGYAKVDKEIADAVARAAQSFGEMGAEVETAEPGFASPRDAFIDLWAAGAGRLGQGFTAAELDLLDPGFRKVIEYGLGLRGVAVAQADAVRTQLGHTMSLFHRRYDLLLTPAMPTAALPVDWDASDPDRAHWIEWSPFTYPFNMTRQPAAVVPCGLTQDGLPIGLQIVGRLYEEDLVLRAARAYEARHPLPKPPIA
jgi:aspartyl-tRNA(Asn)/glutamyl-tRNA(Gln) amidotransferase subunit A